MGRLSLFLAKEWKREIEPKGRFLPKPGGYSQADSKKVWKRRIKVEPKERDIPTQAKEKTVAIRKQMWYYLWCEYKCASVTNTHGRM